MMAARAAGEEKKRPSVETLLHDILPFAYVVHTHPAVVNAVACSREGEAAVRRLFGDGVGTPPVWVPVINPGYVLSAAVKNELDMYRKKYGQPPAVIFLQNHGIFIGADSAAEIQALYRRVIDRITAEIRRKPDFSGVVEEVRYSASTRTLLETKLAPYYESGIFVRFDRNNEIARLVRNRAAFEAVSSAFTPDHIVYAGSDPLFVDRAIWATQFSNNSISAAIDRHIAKIGRVPKIIAFEEIGVYSIGAHRKAADLAFALFLDAAAIAAYTETFGGPCFMPQDKIDFINNWEVERYRSSISVK
jgi:rhamnose utilization protein RhaD (predicted bifunctional aldolase and dehydrogenase)